MSSATFLTLGLTLLCDCWVIINRIQEEPFGRSRSERIGFLNEKFKNESARVTDLTQQGLADIGVSRQTISAIEKV